MHVFIGLKTALLKDSTKKFVWQAVKLKSHPLRTWSTKIIFYQCLNNIKTDFVSYFSLILCTLQTRFKKFIKCMEENIILDLPPLMETNSV